MKVTCPDCGAVYQIDESKIPAGGGFGRCPKCRIKIFIEKESNSQEDTTQQETITCPKCGHVNTAPGPCTSCTSCGIIFAKYYEAQEKAEEEARKREAEEQAERQMMMVKCRACGKEISKNAINCPHCGEFLGLDLLTSKQTQAKLKLSKALKTLVVSLVLVAAIFGTGYLIRKHMKNVAQKEEEQLYRQNLVEAVSIIIKASGKCLEMCSSYSATWREAINNQYDFNQAIRLQQKDFEENFSIIDIKSYKTSIDSLMKKLNTPPLSFKKAHESLLAAYGTYIQLDSLAIWPSGSLMSYNNKVSELQLEFTKNINELKILIPEIINRKQ